MKMSVSSTAKQYTDPPVTCIQIESLSLERKTPSEYVPTKKYLPATATLATLLFTNPAGVQLDPQSLDRYASVEVPAIRYMSLTSRFSTFVFLDPVFIGTQVEPLSREE